MGHGKKNCAECMLTSWRWFFPGLDYERAVQLIEPELLGQRRKSRLARPHLQTTLLSPCQCASGSPMCARAVICARGEPGRVACAFVGWPAACSMARLTTGYPGATLLLFVRDGLSKHGLPCLHLPPSWQVASPGALNSIKTPCRLAHFDTYGCAEFRQWMLCF